jgi:hypothetical protein
MTLLRVQTSANLLDFGKMFNKVPRNRLLLKLDQYGIRGTLHQWIASFLFGHAGQDFFLVVLDRQSSASSTVTSGTVLKPLLFLFSIYDLPTAVK